MSSRAMFIFVSFSGFLLVILSAFKEHVFVKSLNLTDMSYLHTGIEYQAYHTLAIIGIGSTILKQTNMWFYWSGAVMIFGIILFSGSIYGLVLLHLNFFSFITPIGGVFLLISWSLMLIGSFYINKREKYIF
ncbi:DUF423 domain-containing protein [Pantoea sp. Aalb]|uniref:DUF423 domain-containing protein n=1 Tax=Pantoea sp. Aalb TaxID=2576762 RepID=UPI00132BCF9A|nr:DUF423 domain-containing protein [Pantoea sp. Aalb]MXP67750.1 DUF423 domain-containing protein [Pantoea sp. Aalb]